MKRLSLAAAILAFAAPLALAQSSTWTLDPNHSEVDFSILHLGISNVHGRFAILSGRILLNQADIAKSSVEVVIDAASVDTGVPMRDRDLKSANFFNVAVFPTATFTSTSVARNGSGLTVTGNLALHGVTRPVVLDVDAPNGPLPGMDHKPHTAIRPRPPSAAPPSVSALSTRRTSSATRSS